MKTPFTVMLNGDGSVARILDQDGKQVPGVVRATIDHQVKTRPCLRLEIGRFEVKPS